MMTFFDQFASETYIEGSIELDTPIHIGGGNTDPYSVDNAVIKTIHGRPFIPGSSLKGVLRSFLERLAGSQIITYEGVGNVCSVGEGTMCLSDYLNKEKRDIKIQKLGSEEAFQLYINEHSCPICQLFGNQLRAAKVSISDATLIHEWDGRFEYRNGIRMNRDTGKADGGALFDIEVVPAGNKFQFKLRADNLSEVEERWLLIALEAFRQGRLPIGGKTAKGLGNVKGQDWKYRKVNQDNFLKDLLSNSTTTAVADNQTFVPFTDVISEKLAAGGNSNV